MLKQYQLLKGHNLNITTNSINIQINKTQLTGIIADILASENNTALLRAITPHLADKFTAQFPEFENVSLDSINEDGSANVTLKIPVTRTKSTKQDEEQQTENPSEPVDEVDMSEPTFDN